MASYPSVDHLVTDVHPSNMEVSSAIDIMGYVYIHMLSL